MNKRKIDLESGPSVETKSTKKKLDKSDMDNKGGDGADVMDNKGGDGADVMDNKGAIVEAGGGSRFVTCRDCGVWKPVCGSTCMNCLAITWVPDCENIKNGKCIDCGAFSL